ncbi:MAG: 3-deoxy-8-phosphooctulonate synthase, partial [Alphaproteobacteria bacterium]|nr:3-deoxy-8-phosphooctulonate synthase [Alphaproteobacteria bacterium]
HDDPDNAFSDGPNMIHIRDMPNLLQTLIEFDRIAKAHPVVL